MYRSPPRNFNPGHPGHPGMGPQGYGQRPGGAPPVANIQLGGQKPGGVRTQSPVHLRQPTGSTVNNYNSHRPQAQTHIQGPSLLQFTADPSTYPKPISTIQQFLKIQPRVLEQTIKVVDIKQYDEMWRRRLAELEKSKKGETVVEEKVVMQVTEDTSRIDALTQENRELRKKIEELEASLGNLDSNLNYYKRLVQELQQNLNEANQTITDKNGVLRSQENEIAELKRLLKDRDAQIEKLTNDTTLVDELRKKLKDAEAKLAESNQLREQITQLKAQLATLKRELGDLQGSYDDLQAENNSLRSQLQNANRTIGDRDEEIRQLRLQIEDLNDEIARLEQMCSETTTTRSQLESEIQTWRSKFVEANRNHHTSEEKAMMLEAELENIKKGGTKTIQVTTTNEIRKSTVPRQSTRIQERSPAQGRTSEYDQPSLNQKDLETIANLTKQG